MTKAATTKEPGKPPTVTDQKTRVKNMLATRDANRRIVAERLMAAAELIRLRGWCIGALEDDSGRVCLMGALQHVCSGDPSKVRYAAYDAMNRVLRAHRSDLPGWQDQLEPSVGRDKVIALFVGTARRLWPSVPTPNICVHGIAKAEFTVTFQRHKWNSQTLKHEAESSKPVTVHLATCPESRQGSSDGCWRKEMRSLREKGERHGWDRFNVKRSGESDSQWLTIYRED